MNLDTHGDMGLTVEQRRASHAWDAVKQAEKQKDSKFKGEAKKLPVRIMSAGLGQALAFLGAKKYSPLLLSVLGEWVLGRLNLAKPPQGSPEDQLIQSVIQCSSEQLRFATSETLAYLLWLNRFADAELKDDETTEAGK